MPGRIESTAKLGPGIIVDYMFSKQPSRYQLPGCPKLLIERAVPGLMAFNEAPEVLGVIHMNRVAELMDQNVAHEVGSEKQQLRVQCEIAPGRATGPARPLTLNQHPSKLEAILLGNIAGEWLKIMAHLVPEPFLKL